ncbi:hypothetical protein [Streptomyces subrutilus]|uniref:hypothetical protein n=1 Tax=Streptomyces subrutilus TaxID=36818 RepID=UPI001FCCB39D|nr:hypothetical protein [Streptomyces subrutilus]
MNDKLYREHLCTRCFATKQLGRALGADGAATPVAVQDLHSVLAGAGRPRRVLHWLTLSGVPALMSQLAGAEDVTHQHLDDLPNTPSTRYIRDVLVAAGVLPVRDERLEGLPRWADALLRQAPTHHRHLATPFAHWYLLHRIRRANRHRALRASTERGMRSKLRRALELLGWLDETGIGLGQLAQPALEEWVEEGPANRRDVRAFITWARSRHLAGDLTIPPAVVPVPSAFTTEIELTDQLHRCLCDDAMPIDVRTAGALMLVLGLQPTKLLELTVHDLVDDETAAFLTLDGQRIPLPPKVALLVRALRDRCQERWQLNQTASTTPWLFPGQEPARPLGATYLSLKLRQHGITPRAGRNSARLALAADLPASVLADITATSISSATRWTGYARHDWLDYIATRQRN